MSSCTCSKDAQITCIVHPTELSLKRRIAELEAELEVYKDLERRYIAARYEDMNENQRLREALQKGKVINVNGIDYRLVRDGE